MSTKLNKTAKFSVIDTTEVVQKISASKDVKPKQNQVRLLIKISSFVIFKG